MYFFVMDSSSEWLHCNQHGSFATGSADRIPRRKYHSLLTLREPPVGEPLNALAEVGEFVTRGENTFALHNIDYRDVVHPQGFQHLAFFSQAPLPTWKYQLGPLSIERTLELDAEKDIVRINYQVKGVKELIVFRVEPLLVCRPYHSLAYENPFLDGTVQTEKSGISIKPYGTAPRFYLKISQKDASFLPAGRWDKRVFYTVEQERGYSSTEDYFCPGAFEIKITKDCEFTFHFGEPDTSKANSKKVRAKSKTLQFSAPFFKESAEKFFMIKKSGAHSLVAGFPWFEDWDRDTMISLPGLCLSTGKLAFAKKVLEAYAARAKKQLIPGAPVVSGESQNIMVDAPLLFIRAVQLYSEKANARDCATLMPAVLHILNSLKSGFDSRVEIHADGLLFVKPGNYAATWMDVVIDGTPLTPRNGFAVDLNALYYNGLCFALEWARKNKQKAFVDQWEPIRAKASDSFVKRFWSAERGFLADTHNGSVPDEGLRPNQLWATALKFSPLKKEMAQTILKRIKKELVTPVGIRTLSPADSRYQSHYRGGQRQRDLAYHQGTVWPWLLGIYADSVLNVLGPKAAKVELAPIMERMKAHFLQEGCLGQISEVFDAEEPYMYGGTPAQAWSLGEIIRVEQMIGMESKKR